jgi:hypothetical protein
MRKIIESTTQCDVILQYRTSAEVVAGGSMQVFGVCICNGVLSVLLFAAFQVVMLLTGTCTAALRIGDYAAVGKEAKTT